MRSICRVRSVGRAPRVISRAQAAPGSARNQRRPAERAGRRLRESAERPWRPSPPAGSQGDSVQPVSVRLPFDRIARTCEARTTNRMSASRRRQPLSRAGHGSPPSSSPTWALLCGAAAVMAERPGRGRAPARLRCLNLRVRSLRVAGAPLFVPVRAAGRRQVGRARRARGARGRAGRRRGVGRRRRCRGAARDRARDRVPAPRARPRAPPRSRRHRACCCAPGGGATPPRRPVGACDRREQQQGPAAVGGGPGPGPAGGERWWA